MTHINIERAELEQTLEALNWSTPHEGAVITHGEAIAAIEAALAQDETSSSGAAQQEPVAWSSYEYNGIHHKPVAWMDADGNVSDNNDHKCFPIPLYRITHPTPPQRTEERNFCPRCGKRTADLTTIHTCTPPQENT